MRSALLLLALLAGCASHPGPPLRVLYTSQQGIVLQSGNGAPHYYEFKHRRKYK